MTKLESALKLAQMGFRVFPLKPNSKFPAIKEFPEEATSDQKKIRKWWSNGHADANIGISTNGLLAIDVDNKGAKKGDEELLRLEISEGLVFPVTYEQTTPTGGRHIVFRSPVPLKNSVCRLGPGLDTRAERGFIVGAGSSIGGKQYTSNYGEVLLAPEGLVSHCARFTPKSDYGTTQGAYSVDRENALSRARFYLENEAPKSAQGSRNDTTFKVAAKVKDFGVDRADCLELMQEIWAPLCESTLEDWEFVAVVGSAYKYGENPQGSSSPEAVFTKILPGEKPKLKGLREKLLHEVRPNFNQSYLVERYLSPGAMSVVYGESNSGKTFFALNLALHISLGQPWHGKPTMQGTVIYVAAEGGFGVQKRIAAFRQYHKIEERTDIPFALIDASVDLKKDVNILLESVKRVEDKYNTTAVLIVIDTLARTLGDGNENEAKDMGAFIKSVDAIRDATTAHLMVIHHTGKDTSKGARGHSSLRAAVDTEILIDDNKAVLKKQRDMDRGHDIEFTLHEVQIGVDPSGKSVHSCVVLPSNTSAVKDFSKKPLAKNTLAGMGLQALHDAIEWDSVPAPNELELEEDKVVTHIESWRKAFFDIKFPQGDKNANAYQTFRRMTNLLLKSKHIEKNEEFVWIL